MSGSLLTWTGTREVTRAELEENEVCERMGARHFPTENYKAFDAMKKKLENSDFEITKTKLVVKGAGLQDMWAMFWVRHKKLDQLNQILDPVHAVDHQLFLSRSTRQKKNDEAHGGTNMHCCSNGQISNASLLTSKKQTTFYGLEAAYEEAVSKYIGLQKGAVNRLKQSFDISLSDMDRKLLIYREAFLPTNPEAIKDVLDKDGNVIRKGQAPRFAVPAAWGRKVEEILADPQGEDVDGDSMGHLYGAWSRLCREETPTQTNIARLRHFGGRYLERSEATLREVQQWN